MHVINITIFGKVSWLILLQLYVYGCPRATGDIREEMRKGHIHIR